MAKFVEAVGIKMVIDSVVAGPDRITVDSPVFLGEPVSEDFINPTIELVARVLDFPKAWLQTNSVFQVRYGILIFDVTEIQDSPEGTICLLKMVQDFE